MEKHILYRWFNTNDELLYVGITKNAYNRHKQHIAEKEWCVFEELKHTTYEYFESRELLNEAEKLAIVNEKPKYNVTHNENPVAYRKPTYEPKKRHKKEIIVRETVKIKEVEIVPKNISDVEYKHLRQCLKDKKGQGLNSCLRGLYDRYSKHDRTYMYEDEFVLKHIIKTELDNLTTANLYNNEINKIRYSNTIITIIWNWFRTCQNSEFGLPSFVIDWEHISKLFFEFEGEQKSIFEILLKLSATDYPKTEGISFGNKNIWVSYFEMLFASIFKVYRETILSFLIEDVPDIRTITGETEIRERDSYLFFGVSMISINDWMNISFEKEFSLLGAELNEFIDVIDSYIDVDLESVA